MTAEPPVAAQKPHHIVMHGDTRDDPYAWLKDPNWQQVMRDPAVLDPEIRAHLERENAYADAWLADTKTLQTALIAEMRGRIKEDDSSVPAPDGDYAYYTRFTPGGEHPIFCRRRGDGDEEILLDGDAESKGHAYFRIAACRHSPDHAHLAYTVDTAGSEYFSLFVRDLAGGETRETGIASAQGDIAWAGDSATVFYTWMDDNHRPSKVLRHLVGSDPASDAVVYEEPDPGFFVGVGLTESRRFVVIDSHDHTTSEVRLIEADRPEAPPRLVAPRERDVEYSVSHNGQRLLILTNADGAIDFKIVEAPVADPGRANWRDLIPHEEGRLIRYHLVFANFLVRLERRDGLPSVQIVALDTGDSHAIAFEEDAYELGLVPGLEFDTTALRFSYASPTTPQRVFDYDMTARTRTLRKQQEVPSGHRPEDYVCRRLFAAADDGAQVPITLLYRRETPLDGSAPVLLYGYGSYGMSMPAGFSTNRLSLVDRGFLYAIAHIRGGTERGYRWYLDGKLDKKPNTFKDFIAAAEHLIAEGLARPGNIAAHGGSAGGMLVGAVANMRPDLFGAIVAEVPFVDVLNTMADDTLPLTPPEWPEWGNPVADQAAYATIRDYAPYENVGAQNYPHILATAGLTDPRVTYWEPAKWVARLRERKTGDAPVLLRTNMEAGHAGAAGRFDKLKEVALVYAFLLKRFGRMAEHAAAAE